MKWWAHQDSNLEPKDYEATHLSIKINYLTTGFFPKPAVQVVDITQCGDGFFPQSTGNHHLD